jgi:pyridoxal phosphate enzyme (YggS family)
MAVALACERCHRAPAEVTIVAVSKAHPVSAISAAMAAGCLDFGENRIREWQAKKEQLPRRIRWHFIGRLQRNKVKYLVDEVTLVHSIDDAALIDVFERRAASPHDVLIEVNLGGESQKGGVGPADLMALVRRCGQSPIARPVGLMCIPPFFDDPEASRPFYRRLAELLQLGQRELALTDEELARNFVQLSMGMSHDFTVAIEEGATLVRLGTSIFGSRPVEAQA